MSTRSIAPTEAGEGWMSLPLALGPWAERLTGAEQQPMLYLGTDDRYIRLSRGAARLLDALDGDTTTAQILAGVGDAGDPVAAERKRQTVLTAIESLRVAGAFTLSRGNGNGDRDGRPGPRSWLARSPRLRFRRGIDAVVARPADLAARHPRIARLGLTALGLAGLGLLVAGVSQFPGAIEIMWPAALAVLLLEVVAHELAHAAVCRVYGVRVKEAGVMLWGWFLPLAYVDCSDLYRLPARRPRIMVALAGPFVDLVAAGAASAVALRTTGEVSGTAFMVVVALLLVLTRNLTPLLPTDGYFALEAATGELNLRRRAWLQLKAWVADRRPGVLGGRAAADPTVGRRVPVGRRRAYVAYGAIAVLYTVAMFALVVVEVRTTVGLLA